MGYASNIEILLASVRDVLPNLPKVHPIEPQVKTLEQRLATLESRMAMLEHANAVGRSEVLEQIQNLQKWANKSHERVAALSEHGQCLKEQLDSVMGSLTDEV